jgi:hypothetical protein
MKLCFDIDFILYDCASVAEQRYIVATHIPTGEKMEFKNKTELWGRKKAKNEGWIGEQNEQAGEVIYLAEDFNVKECQRPRNLQFEGKNVKPITGAKRLLDGKIKEICDRLSTDNYFGYTGEGETFRQKLCTLQAYKGNREDMLEPLLLKELKAYAVEKHNIEVVTDIEADDAVAMAVHQGYAKWKSTEEDDDKIVGIAVDKDSKGVQGFWHNPTKDGDKIREISGLGKLFLNAKDEIDGYGRMWLYYQICYGDLTDNYKSNCKSALSWGEKSSYDALKDCKTDREAWQALVNVYKNLYPEPRDVESCKGEVIRIDWLYVLQEITTMAHMLRYKDDKIVVKDVLTKLGIDYETA